MNAPAASLDLRGTPCPLNYIRTKLALEKLEPGAWLQVDLDAGEPEQVRAGEHVGEGNHGIAACEINGKGRELEAGHPCHDLHTQTATRRALQVLCSFTQLEAEAIVVGRRGGDSLTEVGQCFVRLPVRAQVDVFGRPVA